MRTRKPFFVRLAVSVVIGALLAWMLVAGGLPIIPDARAFASMTPWAVPGYLATLVVVHGLRAVRWRHLLRPLGQVPAGSVLATAWIGFAAVLLMPLRTGEVVRPYLVARHGTVRGWEAVGTVAAERIIDGLVLSSVLFVALSVTALQSPLPDTVGELRVPVAAAPGAATSALVLFVAAFALMTLFYFKRRWGIRLTEVTLGLASRDLAGRAARVVERLASGLTFLPRARHVLPFALETAGYWAANALGLLLLARGFGLVAIGPGEACVVMGCLGIGILVPSGPGYFGTFQLSVYVALAMFVPPAQIGVEGSGFVFVAYTSQIAMHVLAALAGYALLRRHPSGPAAENLAESGRAS